MSSRLEQPPQRTCAFVREIAYYDDRAHGLMSACESGEPHALAQMRAWHPRFTTASDEEIRGAAPTTSALSFSIDDARIVYARQHGFDTWLQRWPTGLADQSLRVGGGVSKPKAEPR